MMRPNTVAVLLVVGALGITVVPGQPNADQRESQPRRVKVAVRAVDGQPVIFGTIHANREVPLDPELHRKAELDASGAAVLDLPPGTYGITWSTRDDLRPVRVEVEGVVVKYPRVRKVTEGIWRRLGAEVIVDGQPVSVLFLVPSGLEKNRLTGRVTDAESQPIKGLRFDLYRDGVMNCARCAVTDDSGNFEFVCRKFPIRLVPKDYTGLWIFEPSELDVPAPTTTTLLFTARPRTKHRLRGVVVDEVTNLPIDDVWVEYSQECLNAWADGRVKTEDDGRFLTSCYPECSMKIEAWHYHHEYHRQTVELPPGSCDKTVQVELEGK